MASDMLPGVLKFLDDNGRSYWTKGRTFSAFFSLHDLPSIIVQPFKLEFPELELAGLDNCLNCAIRISNE